MASALTDWTFFKLRAAACWGSFSENRTSETVENRESLAESLQSGWIFCAHGERQQVLINKDKRPQSEYRQLIRLRNFLQRSRSHEQRLETERAGRSASSASLTLEAVGQHPI